MTVFVGTSGWQYKDWRGRFYPEKLRQTDWLDYYSHRFRVVEVNNTFYRLPEASTFEGWYRRTPSDFVVGVKMSRYLTHIKRLKDPEQPVKLFLERATKLKEKLGPVLVQLPPNLKADPESLDNALHQFPKRVRVAVEFREATWFTKEVRQVLSDHGAALCLADSPRRKTPVWRTAEWTYLRFHEGRASPHPCYGRGALKTWARKLADEWGQGALVFVFFNNDPRGCAVRDARQFALTASNLGLHPTRIPGAQEVQVP
jgi:uncharacterized protein YecE (DUF72 family)